MWREWRPALVVISGRLGSMSCPDVVRRGNWGCWRLRSCSDVLVEGWGIDEWFFFLHLNVRDYGDWCAEVEGGGRALMEIYRQVDIDTGLRQTCSQFLVSLTRSNQHFSPYRPLIARRESGI